MPTDSQLETTPETAAFFDARRSLRNRWDDAFRAAHQLPADLNLSTEWKQRASWSLDAIAGEINRLARAVARRQNPGLFEDLPDEVARPARGIDPRLING